jgi:hypothetical protein
MAFDASFKRLFVHTFTLAPWDGTYNANGEPQHGTAVSYQGRITGKKLSLRLAHNEDNEDIFDIYFFADEDTRVTVNDLLTLPNQQVFGEDRTQRIFAVARVADEDGQHHVKLQCGWRYHRQGQ